MEAMVAIVVQDGSKGEVELVGVEASRRQGVKASSKRRRHKKRSGWRKGVSSGASE